MIEGPPIPNDDPQCHCILGEVQDENVIVMYGAENIVISVYQNCPLHGEWVKLLTRSVAKGYSIHEH